MRALALFLCSLYLIYLSGSVSVDHSARLDDIVLRKSQESHEANQHAENVLHESKHRLENSLRESKIRLKDISSDNKDEHDEVVYLTDNSPSQASQTSTRKMKTSVSSHGVDDGLAREINSLASSFIPRESIVQHVKTHFPEKDPHEWNDIVISAVGAAGKTQPNSQETVQASKREANLLKNRFQRAKRNLNSVTDT
jgi:hypothetical protein